MQLQTRRPATCTGTFIATGKLLCTYQYYAPLPPVRARVGLTGDLTFSKSECPPTGAIFSSQNASVKTAKFFSFSVFRRFSDLYQVAQRFMKIKSPTPRARSRSQFPQQSPVFPHLCPYRGEWGIILTGALESISA